MRAVSNKTIEHELIIFRISACYIGGTNTAIKRINREGHVYASPQVTECIHYGVRLELGPDRLERY